MRVLLSLFGALGLAWRKLGYWRAEWRASAREREGARWHAPERVYWQLAALTTPSKIQPPSKSLAPSKSRAERESEYERYSRQFPAWDPRD